MYEVKGGSEEHPTHIKALDMSHSLSETSNYTSINEVHWRDKTVNTVAWLATEERMEPTARWRFTQYWAEHRIWTQRTGRVHILTPDVRLLN